ncbi:hypothetical protein J2X46_003937 [Nocardioides sp. BE266]|uniref:hypothetical protein n=1 Tax=Nocardioides sp. BE266 TaxID=2817725 RepID=UPI00285D715E|nr:hypothetical protein [Nocardioides sp. BE266]MDR7254935.1 hypothetical protein [Nocardioides sp. BE266]
MSDNTLDSSRFTDPVAAIDHVRLVARETAANSGYHAAAAAVMDLRREYRIMPLQRQETPPDRLATWDAVRLETRSLVPLAMGGTADRALFDERAATPSDQPIPHHHQPGWAPDPSVGLQAAALRMPTGTPAPWPSVTSAGAVADRSPSR